MALRLGSLTTLEKIEKAVEIKAIEMVHDNEQIICVNSENWHPGVLV